MAFTRNSCRAEVGGQRADDAGLGEPEHALGRRPQLLARHVAEVHVGEVEPAALHQRVEARLAGLQPLDGRAGLLLGGEHQPLHEPPLGAHVVPDPRVVERAHGLVRHLHLVHQRLGAQERVGDGARLGQGEGLGVLGEPGRELLLGGLQHGGVERRLVEQSVGHRARLAHVVEHGLGVGLGRLDTARDGGEEEPARGLVAQPRLVLGLAQPRALQHEAVALGVEGPVGPLKGGLGHQRVAHPRVARREPQRLGLAVDRGLRQQQPERRPVAPRGAQLGQRHGAAVASCAARSSAWSARA